jgi:predicted membrane chloride channel (bestrophin family)
MKLCGGDMRANRIQLMIDSYLQRARKTQNAIRAAHFRAMADQLLDELAVITRA